MQIQQPLFLDFCQHCGEDLAQPAKKKRGRPTSSLLEKQFAAHEKAIRAKVANKFEQRILVLKEELTENKHLVTQLREENRDLLREIRSLSTIKEESDLRFEQELFRREQVLRAEITRRLESQYELREKELTKKIDDTKKTVATLDAQVNERSSRLMGESLELSLHEQLVNFFPNDIINEIRVGARGADIEQIVNDENGNPCGKILWEAKNAKWQSTWAKKLGEDLKECSGDIGIIVGTKLHQEQDFLVLGRNIFASSPFGVGAVANVARLGLILTRRAKMITQQTETNTQSVVEYFSGKSFEKRMGDIIASAKLHRDHMDSERAFFQKKWASQEVAIAAQMTLVSELTGELSALLGVVISETPAMNSSED